MDYFSLHTYFKTPDKGIVSPTFSVGLLIAVDLIQIIPHRHAHKLVSRMIRDPANLVINSSYHS